jgi:hypothetical protein
VNTNQSKAVTYRPKRAALNWVDYLVIAATVLTFFGVVAANNPHAARAQTRASLLTSADLPEQVSEAPIDPALIKARIRLMTSRPWS